MCCCCWLWNVVLPNWQRENMRAQIRRELAYFDLPRRQPAPAPVPVVVLPLVPVGYTAGASAPAAEPAPVVDPAPEGNIECAICTEKLSFVFRSCICTLNLCEPCRKNPKVKRCPHCRNSSDFSALRMLFTDLSKMPLEPFKLQVHLTRAESEV